MFAVIYSSKEEKKWEKEVKSKKHTALHKFYLRLKLENIITMRDKWWLQTFEMCI